MPLAPSTQVLLRCPACASPLSPDASAYSCTNTACAIRFPVVDGVPVLIAESKSLFRFSDFVERRETTFRSSDRLLKKAFGAVMPRLSVNIRAPSHYARFAREVLEGVQQARVLVVGGGVLGRGMESLAANPAIELIETDVALAPRTQLVCDAHDLPFNDGAFDGVIAQAVLEHVLDPARCVGEIHRVLKPRGVVYAETPFMQQVHMGPYDFTRFTHSGHRRLFRYFEELESGVSVGPGTALAWAWQYFLLSFADRPLSRAVIRGAAVVTAFPLKYFDYLLLDRPGAIDAASGVYFLGRHNTTAIPDAQIISGYRGAM